MAKDLIDRPHWTVLAENGEEWDFEPHERAKAERKAKTVGGTCNWIDEDSMHWED